MKQRRIGTLTLGIALIMIGIIVPMTLIFKDIALKIIQFSPLILIVLGVEVLYYAFRYKEEKLHYDGLSIFLVLAITFTTIAASAVVPLIDKGLSYSKVIHDGRKVAFETVEDAKDNLNLDAEINVYNQYDFGMYWANDDVDDIQYGVNMHIRSDEEITKKEVSATLYSFIQNLNQMNKNIGEINFYWQYKSGSFSMDLGKQRMKTITAQEIENRLQQTIDEYSNNDDAYSSDVYSDYEQSSMEEMQPLG